MVLKHIDLVRPLQFAENIFLQVLLTEFSLSKNNEEIKLAVSFNDDTLAIWSREAKYLLPKIIPDFEQNSEHYQKELEEFFFDLNSSPKWYHHSDIDFPFRYASGGALPVVRFREKEYYCLTYHEAFPIGWNIANGGCRNINELLSPIDALERELQQELIIINEDKGEKYVFKVDDSGKALYHPEHAIANGFWENKLGHSKLTELKLPLKWLNGPDSIEIKYRDEHRRVITGCYLNINARDFGIEIDRVAKFTLDEGTMLCHGEIKRNELFNRPIGLFEIQRMNDEIRNNSNEFIPDCIFYDGKENNGEELEKIMSTKFIPAVSDIRKPEQMVEYTKTNNKYNLCPAARNIIRRYAALDRQPDVLQKHSRTKRPQKYDVFISYASEDKKTASQVYNFLVEKGSKVFFSEEDYSPDFQRAIDEALDSADYLISIATKVEYLLKQFPKYEYETFFLDMVHGKKPGWASIIPFISGIDPCDLPHILLRSKAVEFKPNHLRPALEDIYRMIFMNKKTHIIS
jgi:hypothetical protein